MVRIFIIALLSINFTSIQPVGAAGPDGYVRRTCQHLIESLELRPDPRSVPQTFLTKNLEAFGGDNEASHPWQFRAQFDAYRADPTVYIVRDKRGLKSGTTFDTFFKRQTQRALPLAEISYKFDDKRETWIEVTPFDIRYSNEQGAEILDRDIDARLLKLAGNIADPMELIISTTTPAFLDSPLREAGFNAVKILGRVLKRNREKLVEAIQKQADEIGRGHWAARVISGLDSSWRQFSEDTNFSDRLALIEKYATTFPQMGTAEINARQLFRGIISGADSDRMTEEEILENIAISNLFELVSLYYIERLVMKELRKSDEMHWLEEHGQVKLVRVVIKFGHYPNGLKDGGRNKLGRLVFAVKPIWMKVGSEDNDHDGDDAPPIELPDFSPSSWAPMPVGQ